MRRPHSMNKYFLFSVLNLRVVEAWNEWAITVHGSCEDKTCKFKKLVFERKIVSVSGGGPGMADPRHTSIGPKEPFETLYIYCLNYRYTIFCYSYTGGHIYLNSSSSTTDTREWNHHMQDQVDLY
jgi:hypothetical protein